MKTACKKRAQTTKIEVKVNIQSPILTALLCCEKMQERMRLCIISITFIFQDCACFCTPSLHCFHFNDFCTSVAPFTDEWPTCMIASRDYCHAPLGVSSFSFSIQNVWEMTTVVDKIACRSCTACPPPMVLRLFIADTIGFTTVYS